MLRNLSTKLAGAQALVFFALGAVFIVATERMLEGRRLVELAGELLIGAVVFSLLAALLVFHLLTRRLRALSEAVEAFRASGFTRPMRLRSADAAGDDIGRLSAAVQEMSQRIAGQIDLLEGAEQRRRELLANVSHDLRTPLASMQGYLETLLLKHGTLPPDEQREYLMVAAKHSERLGKLISDLFQLTKLEAREVQPDCETFAITELMQDVVQKFQLGAARRGVRLEVGLSIDHLKVHADIALIERVLENLIENAMRHTPAGGTVRVEATPDGARVQVDVTDTGCGIPERELAQVFDRYYRIDRGEAADAGSTGLGLAITRRIVALHGGEIRVDSRVGEGTRFRFDLPVGAVESSRPA
jgi:signal transduction histidine kinase